MAVGKRRTRPIVVDGRPFRWRCEVNDSLEMLSVAKGKANLHLPDRLIVRPEEGAHQILTVSWPPGQAPFLRPAFVRACIELAVHRGWLGEHAAVNLAGADIPA